MQWLPIQVGTPLPLCWHTLTRWVRVVVLFLTDRHVRNMTERLGSPAPRSINSKFIQPNTHTQYSLLDKEGFRVLAAKLLSLFSQKSWKLMTQICNFQHSKIWAQLVPLSPACQSRTNHSLTRLSDYCKNSTKFFSREKVNLLMSLTSFELL